MSYSINTDFTPVPLKDTNLFKSIKVGEVELQNRVVLPPLTRSRALEDHTPDTELAAEYYSQRSASPGTLIITEGTFPFPQAGGYENIPGLYNDKHVAAWKPIIKAIHDNKSSVFIQLWNLGRAARADVLKKDGLPYLSASDINLNDDMEALAKSCDNPLRAATKEEIKEQQKLYVLAAKRAIEAGADGIELHSVNGYFLNQFLDASTNKRTDEYGGSIENRSRFILELIDALIEAVGASRVAIRFSPWGVFNNMPGYEDTNMVAQYSHVIGELEKRGREGKRLAYLHLVEPRVTDFTKEGTESSQLGGSNEFATTIWKGIVVKAGSYAIEPEATRAAVDADNRTLIAFGRYFIANPDLPTRLYNGYPLTKYNRATFYTKGPIGYTDYPTWEQQSKL